MIVAIEVDRGEDLRPLSAWLRQRGVPHRIYEAGGRLCVAVPDAQYTPVVEQGRSDLAAGRAQAPDAGTRGTPGIAPGLRRAVTAAPLTAALVGIVLAFFPATLGGADGAPPDFTLRWLMIVPIERLGQQISFATLEATLAAGEFWHLWTPALLHFGALHLVFNLLWLWEFGRRIEAAEGALRLLELVLVLAAVANVAQWGVAESPLFGGMSGVVYGLLGYVLVARTRRPHPAYVLHPGLAVVLLLFLVLFTTGVTEPFGLAIANGAHWGGLVAGVLWALARVRRAPAAPLT